MQEDPLNLVHYNITLNYSKFKGSISKRDLQLIHIIMCFFLCEQLKVNLNKGNTNLIIS